MRPVFVFEYLSKDKIRDFQSGLDKIDLQAFAGVDASDVKFTGGKVFVDIDGDGKYDLDIVVQGTKGIYRRLHLRLIERSPTKLEALRETGAPLSLSQLQRADVPPRNSSTRRSGLIVLQ